jgi:hypothetical protein
LVDVGVDECVLTEKVDDARDPPGIEMHGIYGVRGED